MGYSYRLESRFFFWILSVLLTSLIFSVLYFFEVFKSSSSNISFIISLVILGILFLIGIFSTKTTSFFYSFINRPNDLAKVLTKINIDDSEKNIEKMVRRFKEVFYNLNLSEKEKSIDIIQKTVGFTKESAVKVYLILKNISFTKNILILSGVLISVIVYLILTKVDFFIFIKETKFFPIAVSLIIFLIFLFESVLISKLPTNFYLNLVNINKKQLTENKKSIKKEEDILSDFFKMREEKRNIIKKTVTALTRRGIRKQDVISILDNKQVSVFGLKDLVMQANEEFVNTTEKTSYEEVSQTIDNIVLLYKQIKEIDQKILDLKKNIDEIKDVQETIEKINSSDWDYYRNIKFKMKQSKEEERSISSEIVHKIHHVSELKESHEDMLKTLYNSFLPYKDTLTKDKVYFILISKGYSYETIIDLLDEFKKNKIDLNKNTESLQDKVVSKINNLYDSFKD